MMVKTKYKTYPKYKPSGVEWIGEIPEGWEVTNLKRVLIQKITDGPHETPELIPDGIPFISAEAIKNNKIDFDLRRGNISIQLHKQYCKKAKPKLNDIFFIKSGATTGNIAYVETTEEFSIWSPLALIRCYENILFYKYLFYLMLSNEFKIQVELAWSYGTQQNIGMGVIGRLLIILPQLSEQRAIADYLDRETTRINGIIAMQTRMIELLKEKRSALITQAVTKGLDPKAKMKPSGVQWIGDIPEGWEVKKIKWASSIKNSNVNKKTEKGEKTILLCNYVDVYKNDFIDDSINFMEASATDDEIKKFILRENDVIITKDSEEWSDIAIPSFITKDFNNVICGYHLALLRPKSRDLYGKYLFRGLQSKPINTQFMVSANGITRFGLGLNSISSAYIILPPLPEQHAIADFLDRETLKIGAMIGKIEKQIELLNEYKQSLITHAVTGKIDVRGELNAQNT